MFDWKNRPHIPGDKIFGPVLVLVLLAGIISRRFLDARFVYLTVIFYAVALIIFIYQIIYCYLHGYRAYGRKLLKIIFLFSLLFGIIFLTFWPK